jgi:hypothetical protein
MPACRCIVLKVPRLRSGKRFEITANGISGHCAKFFQRISFRDESRQRWTGHHIAALFGGIEQNRIAKFAGKVVSPTLGLRR